MEFRVPTTRPWVKLILRTFAVLVTASWHVSGWAKPAPSEPPVLQIVTLTNRADLISDGDALTEIIVPKGVPQMALRVSLNGRNVSSNFSIRADGRTIGLLVGLSDGPNIVRASLSGVRGAQLKIVNHPRTDTIFSGPFPAAVYYCATPTPRPAHGDAPATNGSGLSGEPDQRCAAPTEYKLYYRTTSAGCSFAIPDPSPAMPAGATTPPPPASPGNLCFKAYDPTKPAPADLAMTTTDAGVTVPYVVRVERGVIDRGIYDIAVLFDPTKPWKAVSPQAQWNRKVYYQFAGGTNDPHRQYRPLMPWTSDFALSKGYLVAGNSMTDSLTNSNRVLSNEALMMTKEHIGDTYGEIFYTHATGCSGGAIDALTTMSLYPNLVDGFTISCSIMDSETATMELSDCILLDEAYQKEPWFQLMETGEDGHPYTEAEVHAMKTTINGGHDYSACQAWLNITASRAGNLKPGNYFPRLITAADTASGRITQLTTAQNNCELPLSVVYDPATNPEGIRCGPNDWSSAIFGRSTDGKHSADTRDNVGVEYGLMALLSGKITGEIFVTLNEIVGGMDKDANYTSARMIADVSALNTAYRRGLVVDGKSMAKHPQIDLRAYDDSTIDVPPGAITVAAHQIWRSYSLRDRLDRDAGGHGSHAMWRFGRTGLRTPPQLETEALTVMDTWLSALKKDKSSDPISVKVLKAKPASAADFCFQSSDPTQAIKVTNQSICDADPYLKPAGSPRQVAGGPRTEDILKCQLRPLTLAEYGGRLSNAQFERLKTVFPMGVCDWTKPGVGQQPSQGFPTDYSGGPGGVSLGSAPVSTAE